MILIEYRTKGQSGIVHPVRLFEVRSHKAACIPTAKEYARKTLGRTVEIIRGYYAGTFPE